MSKKITASIVACIVIVGITWVSISLATPAQLDNGVREVAEIDREVIDESSSDPESYDTTSDVGTRGWWSGQIEDYRSGQSNCAGGSGSWHDTAPCLQNAIIRWSGESQYAPNFDDEIEQCYWRWSSWFSESCYTEWDAGSQDDPVYYAYIGNGDLEFNHAVCAEYEGGGMSNFDNWRFFQYRDSNIEPGDSQMPCGTDTDDTYVLVQRTNDVSCSNIDATTIYSWDIDENWVMSQYTIVYYIK